MFWKQLLPNSTYNFTCSELTILWEINSPSDCSQVEYHETKSHIVGKLREKKPVKKKRNWIIIPYIQFIQI